MRSATPGIRWPSPRRAAISGTSTGANLAFSALPIAATLMAAMSQPHLRMRLSIVAQAAAYMYTPNPSGLSSPAIASGTYEERTRPVQHLS